MRSWKNCIGFFILIFLFFSGCSTYHCIEDEKNRELSFFWNPLGVSVDTEYYYYFHSYSGKTLPPRTGPKVYYLFEDKELISVQNMEEVARTVLELPTGELVEDKKIYFDELFSRKYKSLIRYHGQFPVQRKYKFDKTHKTLMFSNHYMHTPVKSTQKHFFVCENNETTLGEKRLCQNPSKSLTEEKIKTVFKDFYKKGPVDVLHYNDCKREFSFKAFFNFLGFLIGYVLSFFFWMIRDL